MTDGSNRTAARSFPGRCFFYAVFQSVTRSPLGKINALSNPQPTAPATSFRSAGVNPSRFIFCENACGLLPQRLANSETLIPSFTHKILICSDVGKKSPLFAF
jgi:hypothetical protein